MATHLMKSAVSSLIAASIGATALVAAPAASAAVTGAAVSPSSWTVGTSESATFTWTEGTSRASVMVRSPWPWASTYTGTVGSPTITAVTPTGGTSAPWVIACAWGTFTLPAAATVPGSVNCKSANSPASPNFFTAFWIEGNGSAISVSGAIQVVVNQGVVTAPSTARTDTWIVGQYSTANTAGDIATAGNVEVATTAVATDANGNALPVITIDIDPNGGTCDVSTVTGYQNTWTLAPGKGPAAFAPAGTPGWGSCTKDLGFSVLTSFNTNPDGSGLKIALGGNLQLTGNNRLYAIYETTRTAGAPTDIVATAGHQAISLSWKAPADPGTYPITHYLARDMESGRICITRLTDADMLTCSLGYAATNTKYTFKVQALTALGWGDLSAASNGVSPYGAWMTDVMRTKNPWYRGGGSTITIKGLAPGFAPGTKVTPMIAPVGSTKFVPLGKPVTIGKDARYSTTVVLPAGMNKTPKWVTVRAPGVTDTLHALAKAVK